MLFLSCDLMSGCDVLGDRKCKQCQQYRQIIYHWVLHFNFSLFKPINYIAGINSVFLNKKIPCVYLDKYVFIYELSCSHVNLEYRLP